MVIKEEEISGCRVIIRYPKISEPGSLVLLQRLLESLALKKLSYEKGGDMDGNGKK